VNFNDGDLMKKQFGLLAAIGIIVMACVGGMMYWNSMKPPQKPAGVVDGGGLWPGVRIENSTGGNWTVLFTGGAVALKSVRMTVTNCSTGEKTVDKPMTAFLPEKNDTDAAFNDWNGNNRINAGDSILLKCSSPNIKPGYKVQFLKGETVLASVKEIP